MVSLLYNDTWLGADLSATLQDISLSFAFVSAPAPRNGVAGGAPFLTPARPRPAQSMPPVNIMLQRLDAPFNVRRRSPIPWCPLCPQNVMWIRAGGVSLSNGTVNETIRGFVSITKPQVWGRLACAALRCAATRASGG
jgi:hypothetical protein